MHCDNVNRVCPSKESKYSAREGVWRERGKIYSDLTRHTQQGVPKLKEESKYSAQLLSFYSQCLTTDPKRRASAAELLEHPFLAAACPPQRIAAMIVEAKQRR